MPPLTFLWTVLRRAHPNSTPYLLPPYQNSSKFSMCQAVAVESDSRTARRNVSASGVDAQVLFLSCTLSEEDLSTEILFPTKTLTREVIFTKTSYTDISESHLESLSHSQREHTFWVVMDTIGKKHWARSQETWALSTAPLLISQDTSVRQATYFFGLLWKGAGRKFTKVSTKFENNKLWWQI